MLGIRHFLNILMIDMFPFDLLTQFIQRFSRHAQVQFLEKKTVWLKPEGLTHRDETKFVWIIFAHTKFANTQTHPTSQAGGVCVGRPDRSKAER